VSEARFKIHKFLKEWEAWIDIDFLREGEFTPGFFPARWGFHCLSLASKVIATGIPL